jgi:DNA-binding NarL/FixJ family response regulator
MRGETFLSAGAVTSLVRDYLDRARDGRPRRSADPTRTRGARARRRRNTSDEIAELLGISRKTVDRHRANMLEKLGMRDRVERTRYAIRRGLIAA